jgi:hypothetical protein
VEPRAQVRRQGHGTLDGIDPGTLPEACPWTLEQILDDDFWPASRHGLD